MFYFLVFIVLIFQAKWGRLGYYGGPGVSQAIYSLKSLWPKNVPLHYLSHLFVQNSPESLNQAFKDGFGCYRLNQPKCCKNEHSMSPTDPSDSWTCTLAVSRLECTWCHGYPVKKLNEQQTELIGGKKRNQINCPSHIRFPLTFSSTLIW